MLVNACVGAFIKSIEEKYETLDEIEQGRITYLKIAFDKIFNMRNAVIASLHDFIQNFSEYGISNIPNKTFLALTQKMTALYEHLDEDKALTYKNPLHVLTGLTRCSVTDFVGNFDLMINTEHVKQMEYDGATVDEMNTLERVKHITLMEKISPLSECVQ